MTPLDELVPITIIAFLPAPSVGGWEAYFRGRGIRVREDDLGRPSITREAARRLFAERREAEVRHREAAQLHEAEAEARRVARIPRGIPVDRMPPGVAPAAAMLQAAQDARPRRRTLLEESLAGDSMTFHAYPQPGSEGDE